MSDLDEASIQSVNAYLLFYVRRDVADADVGRVFPRTNTVPVDISKLTAKAQTVGGRTCAVM